MTKIGMVRHFKVDYKSHSPFYYPEEFRLAMLKYDEADVLIGKTDLHGIDWDVCFSSSYKRAVITANSIYTKTIIETNLIREVSLLPFTNYKIKLPWFVWHIGARVAWSRNGKSQDETRAETDERMKQIYSQIIDTGKKNVLLVTHGFFMKCFADFLKKKGYQGKIDPFPLNGRLYIFEKL